MKTTDTTTGMTKCVKNDAQAGVDDVTSVSANGSIPQELIELDQWVMWKTSVDRNGKPTKHPYQRNGDFAKSNDPRTWTTFDRAVEGSNDYEGVGFMFSGDDDYCGIDLDGCRDPETGIVSEWASTWINNFNSYTEVSPSRTGVKIFVRGRNPRGSGKNRKIDVPAVTELKEPGVEIYDKLRYFAVTGNILDDFPTTCEPRQDVINEFCDAYFPEYTPPPRTSSAYVYSDVEDRAAKYLAKIPGAVSDSGGHNRTFYAACVLVLGFNLTPEQAFSILSVWNNRCQPPWSDKELWHKIEDADNKPDERGWLLDGSGYRGLDAGLSKLLASLGQSDGAELPTISTPAGRTEAANAQRLLAKYAGDFRWCGKWKTWLSWDGCRWIVDDQGRVEAFAADTAHDLWSEVGDTLPNCDDKTRRELLGFAKTSNGGHGVREMLFLARSNPLIAIAPGDMDADNYLLNCPNGTVDLRTGKLRSHRREDKLTKLCPTPYNPDAESYHWDRFLESIFKDQSLIDFVQRLFGYALTGDVREHVLAIFHGEGSNGKSTLLEAYMTAIGEDYSMQGKPDFLMANAQKSHATERMDLFGKRFVSCVETEDSHSINEAFVKALTGGEPIRGRRVYENTWQFNPTHKIILSTNHKPRIKGRDHGIWRRLCLILFEVLFWDRDKGESGPPELECDKSLKQKLADEAEGIVAWAVRGCLEWQAGGLRMPDIVRASTDEYERNEDVIGKFLTACTTRVEGRTRFKTVYEALETWANDIGENLPSRKALSSYLTDKDYECKTTGGTAYVYGLGVVTEAHHEP